MIGESLMSIGVLQPQILDNIRAAEAAAHTDNIGTLLTWVKHERDQIMYTYWSNNFCLPEGLGISTRSALHFKYAMFMLLLWLFDGLSDLLAWPG